MGTLRNIVAGGLGALVVLGFIGNLAGSASSTSASHTDSASAHGTLAPSKPVLSENERTLILSSATKGLKRKRDDIEKVTFYMPSGGGTIKTQVGAYLGVADGGAPYLRMKAVYSGDRWVFFDSFKIMADDEIVLEKTVTRRDIVRDNSAGSVWEIADYSPSDSEILAMQKISRAKAATIRFSGRDRIYDHKVTRAERAALQTVLRAYEEIKTRF